MRLPRKLALALALAALLGLFAAGCGGGGETTESTASTTTRAPTRLTKAQLIEQGDAICGEVNAAVGALGSSEGEVSARPAQVPSLYVGMVEDIEELGTPAETAGYPEFSQAAEELAKVEGEAKLAAEREDSAALAEAEAEAATALTQFRTRAAAYGFEKCGERPHAPSAEAGGSSAGAGEASPGGGVETEPEPEAAEPEFEEEEAAPEEPAPETGGAAGVEEAAPEAGGTGGGGGGGGGGETGGSSGGVGPG